MAANFDEKRHSHGGATLPSGSPNSTSTSIPRLTQGSVTRFLSPDYKIPFRPLEQTLNFNDMTQWPEDPMEIFSQWYADGEHAYNSISPDRMDGPVHWPNTMQISTISPTGFPSVRTVLLKGFDSRGLIFFTNYEGCKGSQLLNDSRCAVVFYWKTLERQIRVQGRCEPLGSDESDRYFHTRPIGSQISGTVSPQSRPINSHTELEEHYVETVTRVAAQVESLLEGAAGNAEQIAATKAKVTELMGALSARKNEMSTAHDATTAAAASSHQKATIPSPDESAKAYAAHQVALASLQRLEQSPITAPLLKEVVRRPKYWGGFLIRPTQMEFWCDGQYRLHSRIVYEREGGYEQKEVKGNTNEAKWAKRFLAP